MRVSPDLPSDLRAALDRIGYGRSRKALSVLAAAQSQNYRAGGGSWTIDSDDEALAYAFARLPATYAAASAALTRFHETLPDFRPTSLIDVGAGPATASFAAIEAFASIEEVRLFDANARFRALALQLMGAADSPALRNASYQHGDARTLLGEAAIRPADLVIASYLAGEIPASEIASLAKALWPATAAVLVIIEPGTPAGYTRVMAIRNELIAANLKEGVGAEARQSAYVAAPCPHERGCPLTGSDWCHFAQRLPRLRDHLQVKGVAVPYEDEKFSYVALSRLTPERIDARVLAAPEITKGSITSKLCTVEGLVWDVAARRDGAAYRLRKDWHWGDAVPR
jgi:ribosomal protein RSM22 (predicted rRNA methylase)